MDESHPTHHFLSIQAFDYIKKILALVVLHIHASIALIHPWFSLSPFDHSNKRALSVPTAQPGSALVGSISYCIYYTPDFSDHVLGAGTTKEGGSDR